MESGEIERARTSMMAREHNEFRSESLDCTCGWAPDRSQRLIVSPKV